MKSISLCNINNKLNHLRMKKFLIWSGIAILAITSCAKDQTTVVNQGHAIGFRVGTETKATELYTYQLASFYCTAVDAKGANYFTNVGFARSGEYFASSPAYYWPADGSDLKFWAYYPSNTATGTEVSINATEQLLKGFKPQERFEEQVDFITAIAEGNKEDAATRLELNFSHKLAQVSFHAMNQNSEYVYKVYGLRIANALTNATYNFVTDAWEFDADNVEKDSYSTLFDDAVTLQSYYNELTCNRVETATGYDNVYNTAMILPQQLTAWDPAADPTNTAKGAYISLAIQVTSKNGDRIFPAETVGDYDWVAAPIENELIASYEHRYYVDFTKGAGLVDPEIGASGTGSALGENVKFTLKVNPWSEPTASATINRQLEGSWLAKKVIRQWIYPEDWDESTEGGKRLEQVITDEAELKDWFGGNGFYQFSVDNNYTIHMTTPDGVKTESKMEVDEEGNIYLTAFERPEEYGGGYYLVPQVVDIDDENNIAITKIDQTEHANGGRDYTYRQVFYYDKF